MSSSKPPVVGRRADRGIKTRDSRARWNSPARDRIAIPNDLESEMSTHYGFAYLPRVQRCRDPRDAVPNRRRRLDDVFTMRAIRRAWAQLRTGVNPAPRFRS